MGILVLAVITSCIVLWVTPIVIDVGKRFNWVDQPDSRKQHAIAMVRVGGIAICVGMVLAFTGLLLLKSTAPSSFSMPILVAILLGSLASFGLGFADDLLSLSPRLRLLSQAVIATGVWCAGVQIEALPLPFMGWVSLGWLSLPITFLWLAGVTNAINWLDGLDGLATGVGALAALALAATCYQSHQGTEAAIALCLTGALLGFLYHNARPAKLFMGDGGAYLIGFLLASVSITGLMHSSSMATAAMPYVILGIPILDMTYVILMRVSQGKSPFFPDRRHLHHRLLQAGFSYESTVWHIYSLVLLTGTFAVTLNGWISCLIIPIGLLMGMLATVYRHYANAGLAAIPNSQPRAWHLQQTLPSTE